MRIPSDVRWIIHQLEAAGHEAYAVGGCVRDSLLGRPPKDWDITTSARPEEVKACFADVRTIDTGLRHGTVTLLLEGQPYEVTTYRVDGVYRDGRHPEQVTFTSRLADDLSRRDFTICAMAYHPDRGLIDLYGGREDLRRGIIRCVGDARTRFREDALRIFRALRFASVLDFGLEPDTAAAVLDCRQLLRSISPERIRVELDKLLCGPGAGRVLRAYRQVLGQWIPEILPACGFRQHSPYHAYDVWEHTVRTVEAAPAEPVLRLTMLFHDIGKPSCFTRDAGGRGHFHGHPAVSARMAEAILSRLRYDKHTSRQVLELVRLHDTWLAPDVVRIRKLLHAVGPELTGKLFAVQCADAAGKAEKAAAEQTERVRAAKKVYEEILRRGDCCTMDRLEISGRELLKMGVPAGPAVGRLLNRLLDKVIEGKLENTPAALLQEAGALWKRLASQQGGEAVDK